VQLLLLRIRCWVREGGEQLSRYLDGYLVSYEKNPRDLESILNLWTLVSKDESSEVG